MKLKTEIDELIDEAERFEKADAQASKSNAELAKVFKAHEENLRQLGRPVLELQKSLPAIPSDGGTAVVLGLAKY
jgi:hypothetical protein